MFYTLDESSERLGNMACYVSGALFGGAWWVFIDGVAFAHLNRSGVEEKFKFVYWLPGIFATIAHIMVNLVSYRRFKDETEFVGQMRAWLFLWFSTLFACIVGAIFVFIDEMGSKSYPGLAVFLQNIIIMLSTMILWFGRGSSDS
eukprot:comp19637_c0_seq1/m.37605 comp19637_c0_seq1/g.37605  ORF comp19637_c0_seq1/g.37605 comp19637_c0_seq1/m.37605 type:complete len:145 (-) comp19637_c0_seq1:19-453(-)